MTDTDSEAATVTRFSSIVSCKWLVVIGVLGILLSLIIGIILGVMAVHLSSAMKATTVVEDNFVSASIVKGSTQRPVGYSDTTELPIPTTTQIKFTTSKGKFVNRDLTTISVESTTIPMDLTTQPSIIEVDSKQQNVFSLAPIAGMTFVSSTEKPSPGTKEPHSESNQVDPLVSIGSEPVTIIMKEPTSSNHGEAIDDEEIAPKVMPTMPPKNPLQLNTPDPMLMASRPDYLLPTFVLDSLEHVILTVKTTPEPPKPNTIIDQGAIDADGEEADGGEAEADGEDVYMDVIDAEEDEEEFNEFDNDVIIEDFKVEDESDMEEDTDSFSHSPELTTDSETVNSVSGMVVCAGTNTTIPVEQVCDGTIHCPGATDELDCCRKNLDPTMICDGIFDCPSLEDEIGCTKGCDESQYECGGADRTCIPLLQRCDGSKQCPNGRDETGCNMLSLEQNPQISVPVHSAGFAIRNVANAWIPICFTEADVIELATDICQHSVGYSSEYIHTEAIQVKPGVYNGTYVTYNSTENKTFSLADRCPSSQLLFVTCPIQCGRQASIMAAGRRHFEPLKMGRARSMPGNARSLVTTELEPRSRATSLPSDEEEPKALANIPRSRKYRSPCRIKSEIRNRVHRQKRRALDRIVGGRSSSQGQWPWTVAILRDGEFICGGALLSDQWILAASHCFIKYHRFHYEIRVGMLRQSALSPFEQTRVVTAVVQHPEYNSDDIINDVAMVFVSEPLHLNQWVNPICLPPEDYSPPTGSFCTVTGWGDVYEGGILSNSLRDVAVPITSCPKTASSDIPNSILCAGYPEGKRDACQGDSGSPLICSNGEHPDRWVLAGTVSYGTGCARPNQPGVYSRTTYYLPFINRVMESGNLPEVRPNTTCGGISCRSKTGGHCVQPKQICDSEIQCYDAQDELNCFAEEAITPEEVAVTESAVESGEQTTAIATPACSDGQFTCSKIFECVPLDSKCDMHSDCRDATDETQCTCADYLDKYNQTLVNDGHVDCWDYSDEQDYWPCPAGQYYSQLTEECHEDVTICDHLSQTPYSEDELNCLTLTNPQGMIVMDRTNRPVRRQTGVISWYKQQSWRPICFEQVNSQVADQVCQYLGFGSSVSHRIIIGSTDPVPTAYPEKEVLWGLSDVEVSKTISHDSHGRSISRLFTSASPASDAGDCQLVNLTCSNQQCGLRPLYHNAEPQISEDLNAEGQWPWHVSIHREGDFICGAILISNQWLLITRSCAQHFDLTVDYVAALLGGWRFTRWASPHEKVRRIVNSVVVDDSKMVMLLMESPVQLNEYISPICLPDPENVVKLAHSGQCVVTGRHGPLLTSHVNFTQPTICNSSTTLCGSWDVTPAPCPNDYSGVVVCSDGSSWFATALMNDCSSNSQSQDALDGLWRHTDAINSISVCGTRYLPKKNKRSSHSPCSIASKSLPAPVCETHRCALGQCLQAQEFCNGVPDCRDWSDEPSQCSNSPKPSPCHGDICNHTDESPGQNSHEYHCQSENGTALIRPENVCNGIKECSDGRDESQCVSLTASFPMDVDSFRNPKAVESSGYLVMRLSGQWYTYCSKDWNQDKSNAFCRYRGFNQAQHQFKSSPLNSRSFMDSSCPLVVYLSCS